MLMFKLVQNEMLYYMLLVRIPLMGYDAPIMISAKQFLRSYIPRSRGLSEHWVFFCGECCIPAHVQGWRYQGWVVTRDLAGHCEHDGYNISVFKRTLLSSLHSKPRKITSSGAKIAWFNQTP